MSIYPPEIASRAARASNAGRAEPADGSGTDASFVCGSFVTFSMTIDRENSEVVDAKYRTNACGFAVAACEALAESVTSRRLTDLHGARRDEMADSIAESLGAPPAGREHCYLLAVDALRSALADHRRQLIDEYSGEKALVCTCFGVSEETIEASIAARGLTEVDEVVRYCRAGGGCGSCLPIIREMLDNAGI